MRLFFLIAALFGIFATPVLASASDLTLVMSCTGPDARMEIYLPSKVVYADNWKDQLKKGTIGRYALDLTDIGKGKPLERVKVSLSSDEKFLVVEQYIREFPPTRVPLQGGTVDFDQRFGTQAKCGRYRQSVFDQE